jgi:hypothetical protein
LQYISELELILKSESDLPGRLAVARNGIQVIVWINAGNVNFTSYVIEPIGHDLTAVIVAVGLNNSLARVNQVAELRIAADKKRAAVVPIC